MVPTSTTEGGLTLRDEDGRYVGHVPHAVMIGGLTGARVAM
jgi:hypothetical protein